MRPTAPKLDKDGFPIPQGFDEAGLEDPTTSSAATMRRVRWVLRMALVAGLLAYAWIHFDVGKNISDQIGLHFGQEARRLYQSNDLPRALEAADRAVSWSPQNVDLLMTRSQLKYLNKDYDGALADAKQAIVLSPQDLHAHRMQRQLFHLLARHREAATAATELLAHGIEDEAELLNSRAYSRALGDFELEDAERDIEKAIKLEKDDNAAYLDTRGYVRLKLGKLDQALADLDQAIKLVEQQQREVEIVGLGRDLSGQFGRSYENQMETLRHHLAVMYHHRGEVYDRQKKRELADRDYAAAKRFGFNPAEGVY
ncbi:MAG: hypothetical protein C0483_21075 [Pirellula sp.]|nr:hypothetical protein [Pirellula sp.]